ncbi:vomeronasal type-1 receptor 4-like [Peromyscus eremicus]|uniref:vomeronasal type-1 receptor 4-like n=1 Tax=Peromyscus eremicus TaxID=42410 RepID=UPI0027DD96AB|nr:vomeronasal type-1 receptor 4-like [Peromyscus eremicus]
MSSQNKTLKATEELALQTLLLFEIGSGTLANILLFVHNFSPIFTGSRLRPTQVIVTNLAVANVFILLVTAFPDNVMVFVSRSPQTNLQCKIGYFIRLVARSTNMCSTCVLSIHQFLTLVPGHGGRLMPRGRAPDVLSYSCYSCWWFSVLNNVHIPIKISGPQSTGNDTHNQGKWFCSTSGFSAGIVILLFVHDAIFISIMAWTSVSMVLLLHRHHQRTQHILAANQNHRGHAESRAAHTILMLVVTFVGLYLLNFICVILHTFLMDYRIWLRHVGEALTACFPTISPFLLIFRDPKDLCSVLFNCCKPQSTCKHRRQLY